MIRLLRHVDKEQYLSLLSTFRPVTIDMSDVEFKTIFDLIDCHSKIYICEISDLIVGTITILFEQKFINNNALYAHIEDVVVLPEYKGHGIGKMLVEYVVKVCKDYNVKKIVLNCDENLRNFYGKNNFIVDGISMIIKY